MSEQDDTPLDPWVRAALLAEGLDGGPTEAQRSRMAGKLAAAVGLSAAALLASDAGAGVGSAAAGAGAAAAAGAAGTTLAGKTAALVIGAVIAGGGVGVAISELRPRSQSAPATPADARDARDANVVETPDAEPVDAVIVDAVDDAAVASPPIDAATRVHRDAAVHDAAPVSAGDLARERQLIDVARSALRGGDLRLAAKSLVEHGMRFPRGALVEEQRVLSIELAVAKGDGADAKARAIAFRRDYPRSVFRARVDELVPP